METKGHPIIQQTTVDTRTDINKSDPIIEANNIEPGKDLAKDEVNYETFYKESINSIIEDGLTKLGLSKNEASMKQVLTQLVTKFQEWVKSPDFMLSQPISDKAMAEHAIQSAAKRRGLDPDDLQDLKKIIKLYVGERE